MRYYEIANTASLEMLDEGWIDKAARWAAAGATAAALGYVAGDITKPPSRDIQQTPASIAKQMDYANNKALDEPAGPSNLAPTTSPRPKPRPADLTTKSTQAYTGTVQTPGPDTPRPKPRPTDLTTKSTQGNTVDVQTPGPDTPRPKARPADLTTKSTQDDTVDVQTPGPDTARPYTRSDSEQGKTPPSAPPAPTQAEVVSDLANADDTVKVNNVSDNKDIENMLIKMATEAGIVDTELQAFLAQAYHESHNFTSTSEQLYGKSKKYFKRAYENPRAARILGNTTPGDGETYRGRGYLQITGRYNYGEAAKALGLPLLEQPELLEDPKIAAAVSVWFWKWRVRARMSGDWDNVQKVTDIVNGGNTAVDDRDELFKAYGHMKSLKREIKRPD